MYEGNVTYQFIGNVDSGATAGTTTIAGMANGSVAWVNEAGVVQSGTGASQLTSGKIRLAQKTASGKVILGPVIDVAKVKSSVVTDYSSDLEQISYWGYNGTSGSLGTIVSGQLFTLSVVLSQTSPTANNTPIIKTIPWVSTAATEENVAFGLATTFNKVFSEKREAYKKIKCEIVCDEAGVALGTGVDTLTFTAGSNAFTADDIDDATTNAALAVGDLIRIGTAVTDPVYKITALDTTNNIGTLDRPVSTSSTGEDTAYERIAAASTAAAEYGLKFTGINRFDSIDFNPQTDYWSKVRFEVSGSGFDSSAVFTESQKAFDGYGTYEQVAQLENYAQMNEYKSRFIERYPAPKFRSEANSSNNYDTITVEAYDDSISHVGVGQVVKSKVRLVIRLVDSLTAYDEMDTVLNG